jgi:ankyrin repeat protein
MSTRSSRHALPRRPNAEFYRKHAKALLRAARAGDTEAIARFRRFLPRPGGESGALPDAIGLHDAQRVIAREHGFDTWPRFHAVIAASGGQTKRFRPHVRGFRWYEERVGGVMSVHASGPPGALETLRAHHPRFAAASDEQIRAAAFSEDDARLVLAHEHGFDGWDAFREHIEAIEAGRREEPFTLAFDAIQGGSEAGLARLLDQHPDLANAQGTNGSTLLNLAVSLRRPALCTLLLERGADVDLPTTRGVTPLHQAAYGNQPDLIDILIEAGASPDAHAYGEGGTPLCMALFWGHDAAREKLATYAVTPPNLRTAAGVGRVDLIDACFDGRGELTPEAGALRGFYRPHTGFPVWAPKNERDEVVNEAFVYASRNGQLKSLAALLARGADIDADPYRGTALTWAAFTGHVESVRWLLEQGAAIDHLATFGGPGHGEGVAAIHLAANAGQLEAVKLLVERGASLTLRDRMHGGKALGWATVHQQAAVRDYLLPITPE